MELWRAVPEGAHEILPDRKCPHCGAEKTHRSRIRGVMEGGLKAMTPLRPFTCSSCHWRGWRVPIASTGPKTELPPLPPGRRRRTSRADRRHAEHLSGAEILRTRQRRQVVAAVGVAFIVAVGVVRCVAP
jgi:hypothetical protein